MKESLSADNFMAGRETPEPPTPRGAFLGRRPKPQATIDLQAVRMYFESVSTFGKPYPQWEVFERNLALEHALLIVLLSGFPNNAMRSRLLQIFLESLNLAKKRGRARKARTQMAYFAHGLKMADLWERELKRVWNLLSSLKRDRQLVKNELLKRGINSDVVRAATRPNSTSAAFLAVVYAQRNNVSVGTARNALRNYLKLFRTSFLPQQ